MGSISAKFQLYLTFGSGFSKNHNSNKKNGLGLKVGRVSLLMNLYNICKNQICGSAPLIKAKNLTHAPYLEKAFNGGSVFCFSKCYSLRANKRMEERKNININYASIWTVLQCRHHILQGGHIPPFLFYPPFLSMPLFFPTVPSHPFFCKPLRNGKLSKMTQK